MYEPSDFEPSEAKALAESMLSRVPPGTLKHDYLPFVLGSLAYIDERLTIAFDRDELLSTFELANHMVDYGKHFKRLTGREYDPLADVVHAFRCRGCNEMMLESEGDDIDPKLCQVCRVKKCLKIF